jgi:hypothetical protein
MTSPVMSTDADVAQIDATRVLIGEFVPRLGGILGPTMVAAFVRRAVSDLRGSVSVEALPEMAARLAQHRLVAVFRQKR